MHINAPMQSRPSTTTTHEKFGCALNLCSAYSCALQPGRCVLKIASEWYAIHGHGDILTKDVSAREIVHTSFFNCDNSQLTRMLQKQ